MGLRAVHLSGFLSAALTSLNGNSSGRDAVNPWALSSVLPDEPAALQICNQG